MRDLTSSALRCIILLGIIFADLTFRPAARADESPIKITFLGDSLSDGVGAAVQRFFSKDACLSKKVAVEREGEIGSGLARADRFHWPDRVQSIIAENNTDLLIVSFGLNDRTVVVDNNTRFDWGSADWSHHYGEQVVSFLKNSSKAKAGLMWLGIPSLREKVANDDSLAMNAIYQDSIQKLGDPKIVYVEPWRSVSDGQDMFQAYLNDPATGSKIQIRASDGVHFTGAGYDMIARYLIPKIMSQLEKNLGSSRVDCRG